MTRDMHEPEAAIEQALPQVPPFRSQPRFSKLKDGSGPPVFEKSADVKSRINWTAERRRRVSNRPTRAFPPTGPPKKKPALARCGRGLRARLLKTEAGKVSHDQANPSSG